MSHDNTLWCVHIIGPDDVHAAPDFDMAERWAVNQNAKMRAYTIAAGMANDPHWPECRAVVAVWPWDADSHANDVPKSLVEFAKSNAPIASAGEAGTAEPAQTGSVHEHAAPEGGDAQ